jgi:Type II CAAX prenyl endopeptidase Rce1-like
MSKRSKFISIFGFLALIGVSSLYLVPLETLSSPGELDLSPTLVKLVLLIQPTIITVFAIFLGTLLSAKVGLQAPVIEALSKGQSIGGVLKSQITPALWVGLAAAVIVLIYGQVTEPFFTQTGNDILDKIQALELPLITKILYGGLVEEIMMRWGLMTLFIWIAWRIRGSQTVPSSTMIWTGIGLASLLFALGHFPLLFAITDSPPIWIMTAVIVGNALPGLGFGWLYYRFGLEAAIIAHTSAHIFSTVFVSFFCIGL